MKYIKKYEDYGIEYEFPGMFASRKPEDEPQNVPGFESGTIDPDDDEVYDIEGFSEMSGKEGYEKKFLKIIKERNFEETQTEIKINVHRIGQDYCMSIYQPTLHINKFLNDELKGMYITKGFINVMEKDVTDVQNYTFIEGIIEKVKVTYYNDKCDAFFNLKLKGKPYSEDTLCNNTIVIDKLKTDANKYNI